MAHDDEFGWLDPELTRLWCKVDSDGPKAELLDQCRKASAEWIEDQRPDLLIVDTEDEDRDGTFDATNRIVQAGLLATARVLARHDSPFGFVAFEQLGAASILSSDPDVRRMLGRNKRLALG